MSAWNPFAVSGLLAGISSAGFGLLVLLKSENRRLGRIWWIFTLSVAVWGFGGIFLSTTGDPARALFWWRMAFGAGVIWIAPLFFHFVCEFINRSHRLTSVHYVIAAAWLLPLPSHLFFRRARWLFNSFFYADAGPLYPLFVVWWIGLILYSHSLLLQAARNQSPKKKNQINYFVTATVIGFGGGCLSYLPNFGMDVYPWGNFSICLYPMIMSYAILKHQLMDVKVVIRKTLVYSIISASLVAVYVSTVTFITRLLEGHVMSPSVYSSAIAAGAITLLFDPLRNRIKAFIDRRFFRTEVDRAEKLARFSSYVVEEQDLSKTTRTLCRLLIDSFHPKCLALYLKSDDGADVVRIYEEGKILLPERLPLADVLFSLTTEGVSGELPDEITKAGIRLAFPLLSRGDLLGCLLLAEKRSEQSYSEEDLVLLRLVCNQAALAFERPKLLREASDGLVHEIKTPMANIVLPAELTCLQIRNALKQKNGHSELLSIIFERMKYIMDQALRASQKVDALQQMNTSTGYAFVPLKIQEMVDSSLGDVKELFDSHRVDVHVELGNDLPSVNGNGDQLKIVLNNLFKNAVEAMARDQRCPRSITISARREGKNLELAVEDTGPGIPKPARELIFQSHYSSKARGGGVGLFLARQIIKVHGGTLTVEDGRVGARFLINLPFGE
jgi:signal transduction histidine kinase